MPYLKTFEEFVNENSNNKLFENSITKLSDIPEDKFHMLEKYLNNIIDGKWKVNGEVIDVDGDVSFKDISGSIGIPKPIVFGVVTGNFDCSELMRWTSLEGSPKIVKGNFNCSDNQIASLQFSPIEIGGDFICSSNALTSLKGISNKIGGSIDIHRNLLKSLAGLQKEIYGNFDCSGNKLKTLKGCSKLVNGNFDCSHNAISNLIDSPIVKGDYNCSDNKMIKLQGIQEKIHGNFICMRHRIIVFDSSLKEVGGDFNCSYGISPVIDISGFPVKVGGDFDFSNNKNMFMTPFTIEDIEKNCDVKGNIYI